jgi:predicted XRE-type DNA-binding protein
MYKVYTLHYARLSDLVKLCELREWNVTGYREVILFLYRYWSCCFLADAVEALENTLDINTQFTAPLGESEVITATRSAEKAWRARSNPEANRIAKEQGYPGAGYNVSNDKLIEWLNITDEEQRQLDTIISRRVKYDRWNSKRQKARREAGMQSRDKYLSQAEERRREAIRLRSEGLPQKQIAAHLGITQQAVSALLRNTIL